jgi:hypothetical protein
MILTHAFRAALVTLILAVIAVPLGWKITRGSAAQEVDKHAKWTVKKTGLRNNKFRDRDNDKFKNDPEKVIEDQVPPHVPIALQYQGLDKEPFLNNFEIRVTNTGNKPIYELDLVLNFPQAIRPGDAGSAVIPLFYGDPRLVDFDEPVDPSTVPLRPGETAVLRIEPKQAEGLQHFMRSMGGDELDLRRMLVIFQGINYGDGTGFFSSEGTDKVPHRIKRAGELNSPGGS